MPNSPLVKGLYWKLRAEGWHGLFARWSGRAAHGLAIYRRHSGLFRNKVGLEIGGPSEFFSRRGPFPVYVSAARIDNVNFAHRTMWEGEIREGATFVFDEQRPPGRQLVAEAADLGAIESDSCDFVLSSHTLEHVANPLLALSEWKRVVKPAGAVVLVLPHKDGTFDHRRPVTPIEHLVEDFDNGTTEDDLTHLPEILQLHDLSRDRGAGDIEAFRERSRRNIDNRGLHHHVFDTCLAVEVAHRAGLQILAAGAFRPYNIVVVAQRPAAGHAADNDAFRGRGSAACTQSPFPSDHPAPPHS